ncbi:hypothetical protein GCM10025864_24720 [Luteimicrobium album]|uniref:Helicase XPB/Ssl2 N-terminal domain-containing protein n=1 Tax=Luteimicrobium album TaxID=1054550 RepID=A0ABQ6I426_9MICO|nr:hypothetical protein [Luteimicrobium album]GMA24713.1 hypothetical protein GCM10025864_24720 [Luteimicrobium album]
MGAVVGGLAPADDVPADDLAPAASATAERLEVLALVWDAAAPGAAPDLRAAPGVLESLGPYPAGLLAPEPATAPDDRALAPLDDAPPGARAILDALTWGLPVGVAPRSEARAVTATDWLVAHGLLERLGGDDAGRVAVPAPVSLALRGGLTHRDVRPTPPVPERAPHPAATVDAEAGRAAEEAVRLVTDLVRAWEQAPPPVLRTGGLGARDLRRLALRLDVDEPTAAQVAELALAAELVADDGEVPASFVPTTLVDAWLTDDVAGRWADLARAWLTSSRTPWVATTRDAAGTLRSALDPTHTAGWAARLRRTVLDAAASSPAPSPTTTSRTSSPGPPRARSRPGRRWRASGAARSCWASSRWARSALQVPRSSRRPTAVRAPAPTRSPRSTPSCHPRWTTCSSRATSPASSRAVPRGTSPGSSTTPLRSSRGAAR